jgi:D-xylose transport system substrate-binding protein
VITSKRRIAMAVATSTLPLTLVGCGALGGSGSSTSASPSKGDDVRVGLLLPETENKRYEKFDYPIIKEKVSELTRKQGVVEYANARSSKTRQAAQMQKMIDDKVDVILLDAVDAHAIAGEVQKAKDAGIPVIAYDRLAEGPIDAYISFDNELVGEVQGRSLLEALGSSGGGRPRIVMMNGAPCRSSTGR